jgi:anaerobic magnesium-protoporphyrin IX monomethyl ester cyclase
MGNIAFIQDIWHEYTGVMSLAASLKKAAHNVDVFIEEGEKNLIESIKKFKPDIIAFSCLTGGHQWALLTAGSLKKHFNTPILFGGIHPTLFPDIIKYRQVDMILRGEGEHAFLSIMQHLDNKNSLKDIKGVILSSNSESAYKSVSPLIEDISSLPLPDRSLYLKYKYLFNNPTKHFLAGRGCPFHCSFCYNDVLVSLYGSRKRWPRLRKPEHIIAEIKQAKDLSILKTVVFDDDTFSTDKSWLKQFLPLYHKEIGLPFICNIRFEHVDEELARLLTKHGVFRVCAGIECGNERIRQKVLKKSLSNKKIIKGAEILRSHNIKILTNNMMGNPDETFEDALQTIKINAKIKTDYPWCSIFQPYPGTPAGDYAIKKGYLSKIDPDKFKPTFFENSLLRMKDINSIVNLQKLFVIGVRIPRTIPIIKRLAKLPFAKLYHIIFLITFTIRYAVSNRIGLKYSLQTIFHSLKMYKMKEE